MARKEAEFRATKGRDEGKVFVINEKSADEVEWFGARCFLALGRSGFDIPKGLEMEGVSGLLAMGYKALSDAIASLRAEDLKPLMQEMMTCVRLKASAGVIRDLVDDDIEEVVTRLQLRKAIIDLHTGFFSNDDQSTSDPKAQVTNNSSDMRIPRRR